MELNPTVRATLTRNLRETFANATYEQFVNGFYWYKEANAIAMLYGDADDCIPFAILSAQTLWERNVELFHMLKGGESCPKDVPRKRWEAAQKRQVRTDGKVYNFALSIRSSGILGCCIDSHILKCATRNNVTKADIAQLFRKNSKLYAELAGIVAEIAHENRIHPAQAQAIIWVAWKACNGRARRTGVSLHETL